MDLETLKQLTDLKHQESLSGLSNILAREAQLRSEIQKLRDRAREAQALPVSAHSMQNIGADVIWLRWVASAMQRLNIELAQVLAQKETLLDKHKRTLGRKTVAENLFDQDRKHAKAKADKAALRTSIEIDLLRRLRSQ